MWSGDNCFPRPQWGMRRPGSISEQTSAVADVDLDRTRTSTSCGPDRDESPAPSSNSGYSSVPGDSEASDTDLSSDERSWAPMRRGRKPCQVPAIDGEPQFTGPRSTHWNNRPQVGNCGSFFGNWGQRNTHMQGGVQGNIDAHIKKNPCTIIGLSECEAETEQLLKASAVADDRPWEETETLEDRPAFQYYTIRGDEK